MSDNVNLPDVRPSGGPRRFEPPSGHRKRRGGSGGFSGGDRKPHKTADVLPGAGVSKVAAGSDLLTVVPVAGRRRRRQSSIPPVSAGDAGAFFVGPHIRRRQGVQ